MLVKTVQVNTFKAAIDSVKDILNEVSLYFHPVDGVTMPAVDTGKKAFVYLNMQPHRFEVFDVPEPITATFEISHLYKAVKNVSCHQYDNLSITVTDEGTMQVAIANSETNTGVVYDLRLVKDHRTDLTIPSIEYPASFSIDAKEFARYLRDIQAVANVVNVRLKHKHVALIATGAMGKCKIRLPEHTEKAKKKTHIKGVKVDNQYDKTVSGKFLVRYLIAFCKAAALGGPMRIKLAHDKPICCEFDVGRLGILRFYLCPH